MLELGKGFLFEAPQKRFTFDNEHFFVDLVFYNRLLQCYVVIDLKTDKLAHQDLGQMQMYVNYFDRYEKKEFEKPTVVILLCKKKIDALVELTLPKNSNIYATKYSLYLPDKALLQRKLAEWIEEFEQGVKQDVIRRIDPNKGGHWEVVEKKKMIKSVDNKEAVELLQKHFDSALVTVEVHSKGNSQIASQKDFGNLRILSTMSKESNWSNLEF